MRNKLYPVKNKSIYSQTMSSLRMYIYVFLAQISFLIASTCVTWSSPILVKLNGTDDNPLGYVISSTENSFLASSVTLGAVIGSIIFGILGTNFGRKPLLTLLGLPFLICYSLMAFCREIWIFFVCRVISGMAVGGVFTILPMYCGEIADASNRGILSASMTVFVNIGMLIPYSLGPYIPFFWFHVILAIIPALFMILFYSIAPESPHYLIKIDEAAAREVLSKIRHPEAISLIIEDMKDNLEQATEASIVDILKSKALRKTLIIVLGGFTFMQLTGTAIVATYSQTIFEEAGGNIPPALGPICVGIAQLIMTIFVSAITDKYPRKTLLSLSHLLIALVLIPFGAFFFLKRNNYDVSSITWIPLVCLMAYVCVYNLGAGPIMMAFLGELFPPRVKGIAISWMVSYNWTGSFLITSLFNTFKNLIGIGPLFWVFACCNLVAIVFIKFFMIETKGKTLEQIQRELN